VAWFFFDIFDLLLDSSFTGRFTKPPCLFRAKTYIGSTVAGPLARSLLQSLGVVE